MKTLLCLVLLAVALPGCSDPVKVPSDNGLYETYFEGVNVGLRIDFNNQGGPKITVGNDNSGPIGFVLSLYEREEAIVFKDLYIGGTNSSSGVNSFLDSERDAHLWVDIYVYNNTLAAGIYRLVSLFPDTWEQALNEVFGDSWLLNHYYTDIQLE